MNKSEILILRTLSDAKKAKGLVVVIDVLRACTTIPILFAQGAAEVIPIALESELLLYDNSYARVGESADGHHSSKFDFNNSPSEVRNIDFSNRKILIKTNNATEAILTSKANEIILASFVNLRAVVSYLNEGFYPFITLLALGRLGKPGLEDDLCAAALKALLQNEPIDQRQLAEQVLNCECAKLVQEQLSKPIDVDIAVQFDSYPIVPKGYIFDERISIKAQQV